MLKKRIFSLIILCQVVGISLFAQKYPYQNAKLPVEERVADLLSRMSLEEKVRQMDMYNGANLKEGEAFSLALAKELIGEKLGAGAVHDYYPKDAKAANQLQEFIINNNRWGIPA